MATPMPPQTNSRSSEPLHTFYLIGDAGLSPMDSINEALQIFRKKLEDADSNSTALFLGDNIYPAGLPDKKDAPKEYALAKNHLDAQLKTLEGFKGKPIFIPGNHDWYANGLKGLERQQEYLQKRLGKKNTFLPEDGCPITVLDINDDIAVIFLDTEWYLTNWDKHPTMNDECDIKSREKFMLELEDKIKDNRDKTTLIAMHHPMFSYGNHGGEFSLKQQLYPGHNTVPLPILGSIINVLRETTGASRTDLNNVRYRELKNRLVTLAQYSERVILVSGHEHTLQYIVENNTPQIVSGAGAKKGPVRLLNGSRFASGQMGYAVLEIYADGASDIVFYGVGEDGNEQLLFRDEVLPATKKTIVQAYPNTFPKAVKATIYTPNEIDKSGFHTYFWGDRYRKYYGMEVEAPTVDLDTLFGGLVPLHKGGGNQSKSLRLGHKSGKEYVMRAVRKSAERYLQAVAFKEQYIIGDFKNTYTEGLLLDFYTGAHPYGLLTIPKLSAALGIYHTNPKLYYIPKQKALKEFNAEFGDELYYLEEQVSDGHGTLASFGYMEEIKNTDKVLENIREDEKYRIDQRAYLRARLFDMALGDWDRHVDQWRWGEYEDKESGTIIYKPIPRDRDQVYSRWGDGAFMNLATRISPPLRIFEGFHEEIRNVKGYNSSPLTYALDLIALSETTRSEWLDEANFIKEKLTMQVIDDAFEALPAEVNDTTAHELKQILWARKKSIAKTALTYFKILNKYAIVTGTDKDDWFQINPISKNEIEVVGYRIIKGIKDTEFFRKTYTSKETKEIWVYGLDDTDHFEMQKANRTGIKIRLIGGQNNDTYDLPVGHKTVVYDYKTKKNTFVNTEGARVVLTDDYETNTYRPLQIRSSNNQVVPAIGFNPDDGVRLGLTNTYTFNGFRQNPFTQQHTFSALFYFATNGIDLTYKGEFANLSENLNLEIGARFTSPNFSVNFFGFGNETENFDDDLGLDFNRVRIQTWQLTPSLVWRGQMGGKLRLGFVAETIEVEETEDRFINTFYLENGADSRKSFLGSEVAYSFANADSKAFPTKGMSASLLLGYKALIGEGEQSFGYVVPSFSIDYKLAPDGRLVLASKWKGHINIGDGFEFYQGASIGGFDGLRGFRNQRFTGKRSYYQNTDIRYSLRRMRTEIVPVTLGLYGGFDYGRVWQPNLESKIWHTSYGGGFFVNGADLLSANFGLFGSDDGLRFFFGLGFGF
ncbi:metallophosphoesterase [Arenibacter sp. GZD96]|uniref:metallophosphoesterase n=1 Tax=Aurantibrevibacter litoralis TaxID=3106030 RepID=UPI002AFEE3EB|nr:metallophosphoesterase [Arenibacter sp. GZD-96]MEA1785537.1 metallophosphoesterase [Arenibacter sp. GZD-96]